MTAFLIKQTFFVGFLSLSAISLSSASLAVSVEQVPNPRQVNNGWVTDMANVLSPATEAQLNKLISNLEAKNGSEIAVVTVPETAPAKTPKQFATALFKHWKIGKVNRNNGVLLLISKGDRRVEIEIGYGVEKILPDARVGNIIQQMTPRLKQGDYDGGSLVGTKALVTALSGDADSSNALTLNNSTKASTGSSNKPDLLVVLGALVILGTLIGLVVHIVRTRRDDDNGNGGSSTSGSTNTASTSTSSTNTSSTSSGSTSSGGGSFGGGSSGGGGADGSF